MTDIEISEGKHDKKKKPLKGNIYNSRLKMLKGEGDGDNLAMKKGSASLLQDKSGVNHKSIDPLHMGSSHSS